MEEGAGKRCSECDTVPVLGVAPGQDSAVVEGFHNGGVQVRWVFMGELKSHSDDHQPNDRTCCVEASKKEDGGGGGGRGRGAFNQLNLHSSSACNVALRPQRP